MLIGISVLSVLGILVLHMLIPTMLNGFQRHGRGLETLWNDEYGVSLCLDRLQLCEFYRRPLMYRLQMQLFTWGIPYQFSFVSISWTALFLSGLLLCDIGKQLGLLAKQCPWVLMVYYTHFTIVFAFFDSMSTYDEPLMYLCLTLAFSLLLRKGLWYSFPFFLLAGISRESSFFFLPLLFFYDFGQSLRSRLVFCVSLLVVYMLYLHWYLPPVLAAESKTFMWQNRPFAWKQNFRNGYEAIQSLLCMFLSTGIPAFLLYKMRRAMDKFDKRLPLLRFTLWLLLINNLIVLTLGLAAEARLFALPLILAWPLLPFFLRYYHLEIRGKTAGFWMRFTLVFLVWAAMIHWGYRCYESNVYAAYLFKLYALVYGMSLYLLWTCSERRETVTVAG
ncbi:MAG: hypothetical protein RIQ62_1318 [Bacteroidota bacterium]|jgi:hypothetical protein